VARRRAQWTKRQSGIDPKRLVFIDETWTKTNMEPLRGWAPKGERLVAKVPHGHWRTMTFVAALRHHRIEAPWLIDGPIDGQGFRTYVEKELAPTLKPGDLVIMDNLGSHKGEAVRQAIRSAGAKLFFLPKYSPDLNPIEQVFAKFKHLLRQVQASLAQSGGANPRDRRRRHRSTARRLHRQGVRQLLQKRPDTDKPEFIPL
jgi:transposase